MAGGRWLNFKATIQISGTEISIAENAMTDLEFPRIKVGSFVAAQAVPGGSHGGPDTV